MGRRNFGDVIPLMNEMRIKTCIIILMIALFLPGCGGGGGGNTGSTESPDTDIAKSSKPRDVDPDVAASDIEDLSAGNTEFALELYKALLADVHEGENLFMSPYSISAALAMTYAGAENNTETQMADTLHFTLAEEDLHPAFNKLDLELESRGQGAEGAVGGEFRLNIVNAIWGQKGYPFLSTYLDTLAENYGAGLRLMDFATQPEPSRITINDWVSEQTENRINDLIPSGSITDLTRLVLTNAIYFNAAWQYPFEEENTISAPFNLSGGGQVTVDLMSQQEHLNYVDGDGYQAVELPYDYDEEQGESVELSMVIIIPDAVGLDDFESSLDKAALDTIIGSLSGREVLLKLPKFSFVSNYQLGEYLEGLGMSDAFSTAADFSGIENTYNELYIGKVIHKAFVAVDEEGTEAAAATAIVFVGTSIHVDPVNLTLDRPFIFLIRDIHTDAILFIGRIQDPTAE